MLKTALLDISQSSGKVLVEVGFSDLYLFDPYDESFELIMKDYKTVCLDPQFGESDSYLLARIDSTLLKLEIDSEGVQIVSSWQLPLEVESSFSSILANGKYVVIEASVSRSVRTYLFDMELTSFKELSLAYRGADVMFQPYGEKLISVGSYSSTGPYYVFEYNLETGLVERQLQFTEFPEYEVIGNYYGFDSTFVFSPDGASIAVFYDEKIHFIDLEAWESSVIKGVQEESFVNLEGIVLKDESQVLTLRKSGELIEFSEYKMGAISARLSKMRNDFPAIFGTLPDRYY